MQQAPVLSGYAHLRALRISGSQSPLFCFFPGFPGARDLADSLPADQPVYELLYPNLDGALAFPAIEELAAEYIRDIRKIQVCGPYRLCGYSKAGLLAYEVAKTLLMEGENVSFLALFETWHPRYVQNLTLRESVAFRFGYGLERIRRYYRDLMQGNFGDFSARVWEAVARRTRLTGWRAARILFRTASRPVPKGMQATESTAVLKNYNPTSYPDRFFLFRTEDKYEMGLRDQTFGWCKSAEQGVDILFVLGDHGTMKDKPYVQSLADKIAPLLVNAPQNHKRKVGSDDDSILDHAAESKCSRQCL